MKFLYYFRYYTCLAGLEFSHTFVLSDLHLYSRKVSEASWNAQQTKTEHPWKIFLLKTRAQNERRHKQSTLFSMFGQLYLAPSRASWSIWCEKYKCSHKRTLFSLNHPCGAIHSLNPLNKLRRWKLLKNINKPNTVRALKFNTFPAAATNFPTCSPVIRIINALTGADAYSGAFRINPRIPIRPLRTMNTLSGHFHV